MGKIRSMIVRYVERLVGEPGKTPVEQLVLHLLLLVGVLAGVFFLVLDIVASMSWMRYLADGLQAVAFLVLYWLARRRQASRLVIHLSAILSLGYLVSNFLTNAGSEGTSWMASVALFCFIIILQRPLAGALYVLAGCALLALGLVIEQQVPEWVAPYPSTQARTLDFVFSFVLCVTTLFLVLRLLMSFQQKSRDRDREYVEQLAHAEKLSSIGELMASMNHEIAHPITVLGMSLTMSSEWWRTEFPRIPQVLEGLEPTQIDAFWHLVTAGMASTVALPPDSRTRRSQATELAVQLNLHDDARANEWAEQLVEANLVSFDPRWVPLLRNEAGKNALTFALGFLSFFLSNQHVEMAYGKLAHLVRALADVSRSSQRVLPFEPTSVAEGLDTVLMLYLTRTKHTVEIVKQYSPVPLVHARSEQLIQVWTNLVRNALQAMEDVGTLTIGLRRQGDVVEVRIADTGPGVADDLKQTIFTPFFTTQSRGRGTGLGLGIVARIVAEHRGTLEVQDAPGGGAVFLVTLPVAIDHTERHHEP